MELRDLIVTPLVIFGVYALAYAIRPWVTDDVNRRYFFPALTVRIVGALAVGFLYQFYYQGGDTFNFHTHGSRHIWEAFTEDWGKGLKLLFGNSQDLVGVYKYASKIVFRTDSASMAIVKLAAFIDIATFSTYSATAVVFAVIGFIGAWLFFITFYKIFPSQHRSTALATLFIPSVVFWGSGLLKDTVTLSCVGIVVYSTYTLFLEKTFSLRVFFLLLIAFYGLYVVKIYILLTLLPATVIWVFIFNYKKIQPYVLRIFLFPLVIVLTLGAAYYAMVKAAEDNPKYSLNAIARTAQVTAYDIRYWTGREAGSGYTLGELDGSWESMIALGPQAINVSLFRPYLWEVGNPLMLLSAIESLGLLVLTIFVIFKSGWSVFRAMLNPHVLFCLVFSLAFAFAVGVSTFNFGSLARYKIPLLPFYILTLISILFYSKSERKVDALEFSE